MDDGCLQGDGSEGVFSHVLSPEVVGVDLSFIGFIHCRPTTRHQRHASETCPLDTGVGRV